MVAEDRGAEIDYRDVFVGWAPFFDCAQRLGVDPIALFDTAGKDCSPRMRDLAGTFARRTDVTLKAFVWRLDDLPEGPCYRPERSGSLWQLRRPSSPLTSGDIAER
jgi:hypothetical protein